MTLIIGGTSVGRSVSGEDTVAGIQPWALFWARSGLVVAFVHVPIVQGGTLLSERLRADLA